MAEINPLCLKECTACHIVWKAITDFVNHDGNLRTSLTRPGRGYSELNGNPKVERSDPIRTYCKDQCYKNSPGRHHKSQPNSKDQKPRIADCICWCCYCDCYFMLTEDKNWNFSPQHSHAPQETQKLKYQLKSACWYKCAPATKQGCGLWEPPLMS